jgi:two-component system response regulator YesN
MCRRFIILSAYPDFHFARRGSGWGVRYYLTKPVEELELQQCIRQIIKEREQAEGNKADIDSAMSRERPCQSPTGS